MMIVSPDDYLTDPDTGVYCWTKEGIVQAWESSRAAFRGHLDWGRPSKVILLVGAPASGKSSWLAANEEKGVLYFDACLDLPWKREPFIRQATELGVPVEVVWLDTPLDVCLGRNSARPPDRRVPDQVIEAMHGKIASSPPSESEGVALTRVQWTKV